MEMHTPEFVQENEAQDYLGFEDTKRSHDADQKSKPYHRYQEEKNLLSSGFWCTKVKTNKQNMNKWMDYWKVSVSWGWRGSKLWLVTLR